MCFVVTSATLATLTLDKFIDKCDFAALYQQLYNALSVTATELLFRDIQSLVKADGFFQVTISDLLDQKLPFIQQFH